MQPDSKLCRALACRRYIASTSIFCSTHFSLLTPRWQRPIQDNREPAGLDREIARRVVGGTNGAIAYIARLEGRANDLAVALGQDVTLQTSTADNPGPARDSGGGIGTSKLREF